MGRYNSKRKYRKDKPGLIRTVTLLSVLTFGIAGFVFYYSPSSHTPQVDHASALNQPSEEIISNLPWPSYGQAGYGLGGSTIRAVSDDGAKPVPIASLAKVITALAVLEAKPLTPGERGPMITMTAQDVASYENYVRKNGTVTHVEAGQQISEYDALQAMLLPSSNNIADTLAIWAFGSMDAYTTYANKMVREFGLNETNVADDASGYSANTTSTAHDLVGLGLHYMQNPVLTEIASHKDADIPVSGKVPNYNANLNKDGFLGIKIGNTDEAGMCAMLGYIWTGEDGKQESSVAVALGSDRVSTAMKDAQSIILAAGKR